MEETPRIRARAMAIDAASAAWDLSDMERALAVHALLDHPRDDQITARVQERAIDRQWKTRLALPQPRDLRP